MNKRLASVLALVSVVVCLVTIREARSGTIPGANGRIAYITWDDRVATVSPSGRDFRILVGNPSGFSDAFVSKPQWSPEGGRVLVLRQTPTQPPHLLVANADGTGTNDHGESDGTGPSWAPDGRIVFGRSGGVYAADLAALGTPDLLIADASDPAWSPDGTRIAFTRSTNGVPHIWVADADAGGQIQLTFGVKGTTAGQTDPTWSPVSDEILYQSGAFQESSVQVGIVNATGTPGEVELTTVGDNAEPVWSPDGAKVGFWSGRGTGFWTMDPDGGNQVRNFTREGSGFDWQPLQVTMGVSRSHLTYGAPLTLSVRVVPSPPSGEVHYYRIVSNVRQLIGSGTVDAGGNDSITFTPRRSATYAVRWFGDVDYPLGGWSAIRRVVVHVRITGELQGGYAVRDGVRLYHFSNACPSRARSCPISVFHVAPNHAGKRLLVVLHQWRRGGWRLISKDLWTLRDTSRLGIIWIYPDRRVVGRPSRVQATFRGDIDHAAASTTWLRFKVTN